MNAHVEIDEAKAGALIVPPSPETAMDAFKAPSGMDPYIALVRKHVSEFTPDVSTAKGRREIASTAAKVARSKTLLDDVGKALVADLKELPKKIDATRKYWRDTLDQIKEDVRRPLTEWEDAEDARVAKHEAAIRQLEDFAAGKVSGTVPPNETDFTRALAQIDGMGPGDDGEDFADAYRRLKERATETITNLRASAIKAAAEAAELEALRREKAEREAKEKAETEAKARAEREEQHEAAEAAKREAAGAAERERQAALAREEALKREAEAAERRAAEAEQRAKDEIARQQKAEADAAAARERDRAHRTKVNNAALAALVTGGVPEDCAKQVVTLIAKGMIPNVSIRY